MSFELLQIFFPFTRFLSTLSRLTSNITKTSAAFPGKAFRKNRLLKAALQTKRILIKYRVQNKIELNIRNQNGQGHSANLFWLSFFFSRRITDQTWCLYYVISLYCRSFPYHNFVALMSKCEEKDTYYDHFTYSTVAHISSPTRRQKVQVPQFRERFIGKCSYSLPFLGLGLQQRKCMYRQPLSKFRGLFGPSEISEFPDFFDLLDLLGPHVHCVISPISSTSSDLL